MADENLRCLLAGIVDYAGLFPPASLDMTAAATEYARQRGSADAWMLGRFVVPSGRLDELEQAAADFWRRGGGVPWRLSVLAPGDPAAARRRIDAFQRDHAEPGRAAVEAVERAVACPSEVATVARAFAGLEVYCEIPYSIDPTPFMAALAEHGGRAKIRSGGVTADAFPSAAEMARFLAAAARADVPFKATAGLHHPLRGDYRLTYDEGSPTGVMHGFLNVFLAAAWIRTTGMSAAEAEALLEETDESVFTFTGGAVRWRDRELDAASIIGARVGFATSYGSCSFAEPVDDLRQLNLL